MPSDTHTPLRYACGSSGSRAASPPRLGPPPQAKLPIPIPIPICGRGATFGGGGGAVHCPPACPVLLGSPALHLPSVISVAPAPCTATTVLPTGAERKRQRYVVPVSRTMRSQETDDWGRWHVPGEGEGAQMTVVTRPFGRPAEEFRWCGQSAACFGGKLHFQVKHCCTRDVLWRHGEQPPALVA